MPAEIIRLHEHRTRFARGVVARGVAMAHGSSTPHVAPETTDEDTLSGGHEALNLAELAFVVRNRFDLPDGIDETLVIQSLAEVRAAHGEAARWRAAFESTLGVYFSLAGVDLDETLNTLVAMVPPANN